MSVINQWTSICCRNLPFLQWFGSVSKPCTPVVHIKIAGKWMFIPLELIIIGFDPPPFQWLNPKDWGTTPPHLLSRPSTAPPPAASAPHWSLLPAAPAAAPLRCRERRPTAWLAAPQNTSWPGRVPRFSWLFPCFSEQFWRFVDGFRHYSSSSRDLGDIVLHELGILDGIWPWLLGYTSMCGNCHGAN